MPSNDLSGWVKMDIEKLTALGRATVLDASGKVIGRAEAIHVSSEGDDAIFVQVGIGQELNQAVVPLAEATLSNDKLVVPYSQDKIDNGPRVVALTSLSTGEASSILSYYEAGQVDFRGTMLNQRSDDDYERPAGNIDPLVIRPLPPIVIVRPSGLMEE